MNFTLSRALRRLSRIPNDRLALILLISAFAGFLFLSKLASPYPNGYAGLYTLMAERIAANGFVTPATIPLYGPGGIPFAYPPLAFYLMAAITTFIKVQPFDYLRFAPALFYLLSLLPMYALSRAITASPRQALLATFLMGTSAGIIAYHYGADGMARGLALLWMLWALVFAQRAFEESSWLSAALAALFLALTILTHLSYAVAGAVSIGVFALFVRGAGLPRRMLMTAAIGVGSALGAMAWWLPLIQRLGVQTLLNALNTHGNLNALDPAGVLFQLRLVFFPRYELAGFMLAVVAGLVLQIVTKKAFLPVWAMVIALACGSEGQRFVALVGAMLAACALAWAYVKITHLRALPRPAARLTGAVYWVVLLALFFLARGNPFALDRASLEVFFSGAADLSGWFQANTPAQASYLLLSGDDWQQEWLPYLLKRTSAIGPFGAEWTGGYPRQLALYNHILVDCSAVSLDCVLSGLQKAELKPDLLVTRVDPAPGSMDSALSRDAQYQRVYANASFDVWRESE